MLGVFRIAPAVSMLIEIYQHMRENDLEEYLEFPLVNAIVSNRARRMQKLHGHFPWSPARRVSARLS